MYKFLCLFLLTLTPLFAAKEGHVEILDHNPILLREHYLFFEDQESLSVEEVLQKPFIIPNREKSFFPYPKGAIWLSFTVKNNVEDTSGWIMTLPFAAPKKLEIFAVKKDGSISRYEFSDDIRSRLIVNLIPAWPLQLKQGEEVQILIRHEDPVDINTEWQIVDAYEFHILALSWFFAIFVFMGIMLALTLFNGFLWLTLRDNTYVAYILFCATMIFTVLALSRFTDIYLGVLTDVANYRDAVLLLPPMAALIFMNAFLQMRKRRPKIAMLSWVFMGFQMSLLAARMWGFRVETLIDPVITLTSLTILICGLDAALSGFRPARIYLLAWGTFIACVAMWLAGRAGLIPLTLFVTNLAQLGHSLEAILMSIALGERIKLLNEEKDSAQEKARDKLRYQQMVRVLCHDINNPLSVIALQTDMLLRTAKEPDTKFLERIKRAAGVIIAIIEKTRNSEATRTGKRARQKVLLQDIFQECQFMFEHALTKKKIEFKSEITSGISVLVDKLSFENEVIHNLVSNAIKFCYEGGLIIFRAQVVRSEVVLEIIDNGIGMPKKILADLFNDEANVSRPGTKNEAGTGFGMSLIKNYVEDAGGTIVVASSEDGPERGTRVRIRLPLEEKS